MATAGVSTTRFDVSTATPTADLGDIFERRNPTYGKVEQWIYVKNGAVALVIGNVCVRATNVTTTYSGVIPSAHADPTIYSRGNIVGVAQAAVPAAYYCWLLRDGVGLVKADTGGVTAGQFLSVGNAKDGQADSAATASANDFGVCMQTKAVDLNAISVISCAG